MLLVENINRTFRIKIFFLIESFLYRYFHNQPCEDKNIDKGVFKMTYTPLMIDLVEKNVVIVGGGQVAERRISTLLESGACLTVISPETTDHIHSLSEKGLLNWKKKYFEPSDLEKAFLIVAATNDSSVNELIRDRTPNNAILNMATDAEKGNVHFPSHFKRGRLLISISTNGASPLLTAKIKKNLHTLYDDSYGDYVDFLYECRQHIKRSSLTKMEKQLLFNELMSDVYLDSFKQKKTMEWLERLTKKGKLYDRA